MLPCNAAIWKRYRAACASGGGRDGIGAGRAVRGCLGAAEGNRA